MDEKKDYKKIGFRCGIEIHQQLDTHKLFCKCPSIVHDNNPDITFTRKLRPVAGETGEIDAAAMHEVLKGKYYAYEACSTSSCLVEMDEEPPHPINEEAVRIVLEAAQHMNAKIVDEIQVMRKTVIDGSNVSGFQRTALVAYNGHIETSKGIVRIQSICVEEDAAKKIETTKEYTKYRLDRLGIPLIEIATDPDIKDPEHAKEVAEKLGMILRSTKVKRGIGSIRQDVNISIRGGARTEIKGFQDLKSIQKVIEKEVDRQIELIRKGKKINQEVRKAKPDFTTSFLRPMPGAARMYPETDVLPVKASFDGIEMSELIEDKIKRYVGKNKISPDLAKALAKSDKADLFDNAMKKFKNLKSPFVAETLVSAPREIRRKYNIDISSMADKDYIKILDYIDKGMIPKDAMLEVMIDFTKGKFDISKYKGISEEDLEKEVKDAIINNKGASTGALMGMIMAKFRGKVDGKRVMELLNKFS